MIQALIFDFDGLILDTEISAFQSWQEIYEAYGCQLPLTTWAACVGGSSRLFNPCDYLEQQVGRPLPREALIAQRRQRHAEMVASLPLLPGVAEYIADAERLGLKIGLASSSSCEWVNGHLTRFGIRAHFECIRCANNVTHTKPHPELYLSVLEGLGVRASDAIALEDSPNGVLAAQRAGIFCVVVPNPITSQLPLDHADLRLTSLSATPLETLLAEVQKLPSR